MNQLNPNPPVLEKPGEVTTITILTLISGITNVLVSLIYSILIVVGTIGIGIICLPITILPLVLGIFEIIYAANLLSTPPKKTQPSQLIAIFEIVAILYLNIISLVTGILALVFYNNPNVKEFFNRLKSG